MPSELPWSSLHRRCRSSSPEDVAARLSVSENLRPRTPADGYLLAGCISQGRFRVNSTFSKLSWKLTLPVSRPWCPHGKTTIGDGNETVLALRNRRIEGRARE